MFEVDNQNTRMPAGSFPPALQEVVDGILRGSGIDVSTNVYSIIHHKNNDTAKSMKNDWTDNTIKDRASNGNRRGRLYSPEAAIEFWDFADYCLNEWFAVKDVLISPHAPPLLSLRL